MHPITIHEQINPDPESFWGDEILLKTSLTPSVIKIRIWKSFIVSVMEEFSPGRKMNSIVFTFRQVKRTE